MAICRFTGDIEELPEWAKGHILPEEAIVHLPGLRPITNVAGAKFMSPGDYIIEKADGTVTILSPDTMNAIRRSIY